MTILSLAVSAALHAFVMYGFNEKAAPVQATVELDDIEVVFLTMPPIEEEPEEVYETDGPAEEIEPGEFVPMLADVPSSVALDATFVQELDLNSLRPQPDFERAAVVSIPPNIAHGRVSASQISNVFNLSDLDREPRPIFQPSPVFPPAMKKIVDAARVDVEFIVDENGKVIWAKVINASYQGFEDAAVLGVSRWQFRPGRKNGKAVKTRMRVPLMFRIIDD